MASFHETGGAISQSRNFLLSALSTMQSNKVSGLCRRIKFDVIDSDWADNLDSYDDVLLPIEIQQY